MRHRTSPRHSRFILHPIYEGTKKRLYTFTIVTTDASKQLDWLHDRMPVVLPSDVALNTWLNTSSQTWDASAAALIKPYPSPTTTSQFPPSKGLGPVNIGLNLNTSGKSSSRTREKEAQFGELECYAVPTDVGKVGAESPTFIEPVQRRRDGIEALFARAKRVGKATEGEGEGKVDPGMNTDTKTATKAKGKEREETPSKRKRQHQSSEAEEKPEKERDSSVELLETPPPAKKSRKPGSKSLKSPTKASTSVCIPPLVRFPVLSHTLCFTEVTEEKRDGGGRQVQDHELLH